ncbi:DUF1801 domain-containing protein [Micromonospora sp. M12]
MSTDEENAVNDEVTQYINKTQPWQVEVCEKLRAMIDQTVPGVEERLQYGKPHYLKNGHYAAVIAVAKARSRSWSSTPRTCPRSRVPPGDGQRRAQDRRHHRRPGRRLRRTRRHPGKDQRCPVATSVPVVPARVRSTAWAGTVPVE